MRRTALGLPILIGLSVCTPAWAQAPSPQVPAIKPTRDIQVHAGVVVEHHTNVAQTSAAIAAQRGVEREDSIARPVVNIDAFQPIGRNGVYVKGSGGYQFHRKNSQLDSAVIDLSGGAVSNLGICQATAYGGYARARSELGDLVGPATKNLLTTRTAGSTVSCGRANGFGGVASVSRAWQRNSATLVKESNATIDSASLILNYGNPGLGKFSLISNYIESDYPNRRTGPLPADPIGEMIQIAVFGVGYEKKLGTKLNLKGNVSRSFLKRGSPPPGIDPKFESNTYGAAINYKVSPRLGVDLTLDRAITPSSVVGKLYDRTTDAEAVIRYKIGTSFNVRAGAKREDLISNTDGVTQLLIYSKAQTESVYGAIQYRRAKLGSIELEVRQTNRDADKPTFNYSDTRIALTIDARY